MTVNTFGIPFDKWFFARDLAAQKISFRQAWGLAFIDRTAQANKIYTYQLRGNIRRKGEVVLVKEITLSTKSPQLPLPPAKSQITAIPGDSRVLLLWNKQPGAYEYMVQRSAKPSGGFQVINKTPVVLPLEYGLDNNKLKVPRPGFMDFMRHDPDGAPMPHKVNGVSIKGPFNGTTYYYQVACRDILGRQGAWSAPVPAKPYDRTPPMAPADFTVTPKKPSPMISERLPDITAPGPSEVTGSQGFTHSIKIQWRPNQEKDLAGYQVWRTICDKGNFYPPPGHRCGLSL